MLLDAGHKLIQLDSLERGEMERHAEPLLHALVASAAADRRHRAVDHPRHIPRAVAAVHHAGDDVSFVLSELAIPHVHVPFVPVEEAGSVTTPHPLGDGVALTLPNREAWLDAQPDRQHMPPLGIHFILTQGWRAAAGVLARSTAI
jgi:hypothetical protein